MEFSYIILTFPRSKGINNYKDLFMSRLRLLVILRKTLPLYRVKKPIVNERPVETSQCFTHGLSYFLTYVIRINNLEGIWKFD